MTGAVSYIAVKNSVSYDKQIKTYDGDKRYTLYIST